MSHLKHPLFNLITYAFLKSSYLGENEEWK